MSYLQDLQVLTNWFVIRPTSSLRFRVLLLTKFLQTSLLINSSIIVTLPLSHLPLNSPAGVVASGPQLLLACGLTILYCMHFLWHQWVRWIYLLSLAPPLFCWPSRTGDSSSLQAATGPSICWVIQGYWLLEYPNVIQNFLQKFYFPIQ